MGLAAERSGGKGRFIDVMVILRQWRPVMKKVISVKAKKQVPGYMKNRPEFFEPFYYRPAAHPSQRADDDQGDAVSGGTAGTTVGRPYIGDVAEDRSKR